MQLQKTSIFLCAVARIQVLDLFAMMGDMKTLQCLKWLHMIHYKTSQTLMNRPTILIQMMPIDYTGNSKCLNLYALDIFLFLPYNF